jgi:hypothetical protein
MTPVKKTKRKSATQTVASILPLVADHAGRITKVESDVSDLKMGFRMLTEVNTAITAKLESIDDALKAQRGVIADAVEVGLSNSIHRLRKDAFEFIEARFKAREGV